MQYFRSLYPSSFIVVVKTLLFLLVVTEMMATAQYSWVEIHCFLW
jgi:hypothetical protein